MSSVRVLLVVYIGSALIAGIRADNMAQRSVPTPHVSVSCSVTKPGTAAATILWPTVDAPIRESRLDVTVYHNGFSRGTYAYFPALGNALRGTRAQQRFPPQFSDSSPPRDDSLPAYRLTAFRVVSRPDTTVFRVDGLEDGINYYWRVAVGRGNTFVPGAVRRVPAPTCMREGTSDRG